jgi:hypothetical protein
MAWPLALVALTTTRTLFFQALMLNDLHRFFQYFDFLSSRQNSTFNVDQTFATFLTIIRAMADDFVGMVAKLERFAPTPCLST